MQLATAPTREAELLEFHRATRGALGSAPAQEAARLFDLLERIDAALAH